MNLRRFRVLVGLILGLVCSGLATAEETPLASPTPNKYAVFKDDFDNWELELAENSYQINKKLENKIRLLRSYEKVLSKRCMAELHTTLSYLGNPKDPICVEYIARTFKLDKNSMMAICTRDGIDSRTCRVAASTQKLGEFNPEYEQNTEQAILDDVLINKREEPKIAEESSRLKIEVETLRNSRKPLPDDKFKISEKLARLLNLNCRRNRIRLDNSDQEEVVADPTPTVPSSLGSNDFDTPELPAKDEVKIPTPASNPYADLLSDMEKRERSDKESPSKRIYEVTSNCNIYIDLALRGNPDFALAKCYGYGFYTPQCIDAKRKEKLIPVPKNAPIAVPTVRAIATF